MEIKGLSMTDELRMIRGVESIYPKKGAGLPEGDGPGKVSFAEFLEQQVSEVNRLGLESDYKIQQAVTDGDVNPHETMIAVQKADISFRLMMSVKEKLIQAYQQLIRTPIG